MKNFVLTFIITFTLIVTATFSHSQEKYKTAWEVDTIFELEYDTIEKEHVAKYVSDVITKMEFEETEFGARLTINIYNYEKLDWFNKYARNGNFPPPEEIKLENKKVYALDLITVNLEENQVVYWTEGQKDKIIVYINDEGFSNDLWHFSEFDEELDLYTVSRYFSVPF